MTHVPESANPSPFDADAVYLQKTLRHEPMELGLDDSVSLRTLLLLLVRAYLASAIIFFGLGFIAFYEVSHGNGNGQTLFYVGLIVSAIVFLGVLLGSKVTEPIGEWRALLANRGGQSEGYYRMITAVLERRRLPIKPQLRRIELNGEGRPVKHTIVLSENEYQTYVTVFPYGTSLYVGWQMWRRRSGAQLFKRALIDKVTAANLVTAMLRTDRARAVREAVHLACREAVYATADEGLLAHARQLRLPQVEQESALLQPQPASPVLPPASSRIPASAPAGPTARAAPAPPARQRTAAPKEPPPFQWADTVRATADPVANGAFLSTNDGSGCWTWAGVRLFAEGAIGATQRFADLSWDERRKRVTEQESAWLAAQWDTPAPGSRFEVRFATGASAAKVRAAFFVRVLAATPEQARRLAGERLRRAADRGGALPPHVGARPIDSAEELRNWLGFPSQVGGFVEVCKHLSANRIARGGTALTHAVCHGFFGSGAAWDAWWRSFAALPFPAVLSIGFEPYDADNPTFRSLLRQRAADLEELARAGVPSPLNPYAVPADPAARAAVPGYRRARARYGGRCFSIRVAVASARPLPLILLESLARTVSSVTGAARAVPVAGPEFDQAVGEFQALGAPWLPATHHQGLPAGLELDALDRLLHVLTDVEEAASVLTLPVHWPGMPPVFDRGGQGWAAGE